MRAFASLLLLLLLPIGHARAADITLFRNGLPVPNYDEMVRRVAPGDVLIFTDNGDKFSFRIKSRIYPRTLPFETGQSTIFELTDGRALRVPRNTINTPSISLFLDGYRDLLKDGIQFMNVDLTHSRPEMFVVHDKLNIQFTLESFLKSQEIGSTFQGVDTRELKGQLLNFAERLQDFEELGDFNLDQVGWARGRWVLFDYGHPNVRAPLKSQTTVFSFWARSKESGLSHAGQALIREIDAQLKMNRALSCLEKELR